MQQIEWLIFSINKLSMQMSNKWLLHSIASWFRGGATTFHHFHFCEGGSDTALD